MTVMKLELSLHASKLKNVAGAFKGTSDPFAVVTKIATTPGSSPQVLGKTEVIKNTLSPEWVKVFTMDYELGTPVKLAISIFDEVRKGENKSMGSAVFEVGELLGARGNTKAKKLQKGGTIFATVRKSQGSGMIRLQMKGTKLKNVEGLFGKSDPFYELSRKVDTAGGLTWDNVYRSEVKKNNLNPEWDAAIVALDILCGGNLDLPIQVAIFDHESSGKHVAMGKFETTVNGFQKAAQTGEAIHLKQKGKDVGSITIVRAEVTGVQSPQPPSPSAPIPSAPQAGHAGLVAPMAAMSVAGAGMARANFVDYVSGGCELNVVVAVDLTGSNGDPRQPGTLHYLQGGMNDYEKAIHAIVSILAPYDSDQKFPVVGFGAKYGGVVQHCFQCGPTSEAQGVQGVLEAYRSVFSTGLVMSGPTVFTDVIQMAASRASNALEAAKRKGGQAYTILLILTDGAVSDVRATAQCLDQVSECPLSVVIVGVGNADFSSMQFLDDSARPGKRDIAQFVEFNKHSAHSVQLTSETLKEIPDQLVGFFQSRGMAPLPAIQRGDSIVIEPEDAEIDLSLDIRDDQEIVVTGGGRDDFASGFRK